MVISDSSPAAESASRSDHFQTVNPKFSVKRMEENSAKVFDVTKKFYELSMERGNSITKCGDGSVDLLAKRQSTATDKRKEYDNEAILEGLIITTEKYFPSN